MKRAAVVLAALLAAVPAFARTISREELQKALDANPDLVLAALKKADQTQLFDLVISAQRAYQIQEEKKQEAEAKAEQEAAFKNPLEAEIGPKTLIRGDKDAPITVVEYSDFQCPFCGRGFRTVEALRKKYGKHLRFVFKNLPLVNLHPQALPAAEWHEAVALQSPAKSWLFHDKMFENQDKLGDSFYRQTVKELGLNVKEAEKAVKGKKVMEVIAADVTEAHKFGFSGTPGFLINGVPLRGAYPLSEFDKIIARLAAEKKNSGWDPAIAKLAAQPEDAGSDE
ncbi:MAG: thioredoxin domain-containing protein [Elusimicrobia bacterium]|nr:thioredoxin domain-containing protein [Elusimicrobiota bacterium]